MASKQLAIKEVLNLNFAEYSSTSTPGDDIFYADYCANTSAELSAERLDLRGGQGNYKLVSFDHTKNAMVNFSAVLVDLEFIARLTGKSLVEGAAQVKQRDVLTADGSNEVTLTQTPVAGTLKVYLLSEDRDYGTEQTAGTPATTENEYSISGTTITLNATTAPSGTKVVCTYEYSSPANTRTMTFTADKFPGYMRITGDGLATDQVTGTEYAVKFDFKKAKPQNTFTITQSSTEATQLDITFDLFSVDVDDGSGGIDKVYFTMHEMVP